MSSTTIVRNTYPDSRNAIITGMDNKTINRTAAAAASTFSFWFNWPIFPELLHYLWPKAYQKQGI